MRHKYDGKVYRLMRWGCWTELTLRWVEAFGMYAVHTKNWGDGLFGHVRPCHVRAFIRRHHLEAT